ncbi:BHLH family transcription factor [Botrytis cinerea]
MSSNFGDRNTGMHPPLSQPSVSHLPPSTESADVLAAATVLQNGSNARSHSLSSETLFGNHGLPSHPGNHHIRPQSMSHYPTSISGLDRPRDGFMRDTLYTEMMFGPNHAGPDLMRRPKPVPQKVDIRWGSDAGFGSPQGFVPPPNAAKVEESERQRLQTLDGFIGSNNAKEHTNTTTAKLGVVKEEDTEPPKKRRKSKFSPVEDAGEDDEEPQPKVDGRRKRKSVVKISGSSPGPSEAGHKRRKSSSAAAKSTRENLTEDQKRENHIKSEQKRRTLIREGFEDLGELVPGLRGGGFSKSAILVMTADWLEELMQGNQALRSKIDAAKGR